MEKSRLLPLAVFASFFSLGYLALNYFVLTSLAWFLGVINLNYIYAFVGLVSISLPASMLFEQKSSSTISRAIYMLSTTWMGISLYFLWAIIVVGILMIFVNIPLVLAGIIIIASVALISAYSLVNAYHTHEKKIEIPIPNLKSTVRFVQLSDVHIGSVRNSGFLKRVVTKIKDINPEAVLITGDLADGSSAIYKNTFYPLKDLKMPIFFTAGNHDSYSGIENVFNALKYADVHIIHNDLVEFQGIQIIGASYSMQRNYLGNFLNQLDFDREMPSILMYHLPSEWDTARENGINLQLSGHTHSGQFYPFNLIVKLIFPYLSGLYKNENDHLYVSSGTGTWGPPMRLGSRNEITVIELKPSE